MTDAEEDARSVADRLNWLFKVAEIMDPVIGWRPYTNAEVGQAVGISGDAVARVRAGENANAGQLDAIASFFDVDPAFFRVPNKMITCGV